MTKRRDENASAERNRRQGAEDRPSPRAQAAPPEGRLALGETWQSGTLYRDLIEQVKDYAIFCTDAEGRATTWNRGVERLLGYSESEFVGHDARQRIFTPEDVDAGVPDWEMQEAIQRGSANDNRWMQRKGGERFYCSGMTTALRDDAGRLLGFAKVMQDRTMPHLQSERLREKTAQLASANRQKDQFLAVLSHELRNPLAPIRNGVEVLRSAPADSPQAKRVIDAIDRQSSHLAHLVDELLDLTGIGQGKITLQRSSLDLCELTRTIADDYVDAFEASGITFALEHADGDLRVNGDRMRLGQVVRNLLDNAKKFTPSGGRVVLRVERRGDEAVVSVTDTGTGIEPASLAVVFEPFVQSEATMQRSVGGLGLGLALVKGFVDMHGGRVHARSEGPGRGTALVVCLPLAGRVEVPARTELYDEPQRVPRKVLIIEDNGDAADILRTALVLRGHRVETAHTGPEGLKRASEFEPEVVLCDLGLPGLDGYEVARRIRAEPLLQSSYLVAVSGYALPRDVDKAMQAGFDQHMAKPPDLDALDRVISLALHRQS